MTTSSNERDSGPWYREPWPWLLMLGPFLVIVAGVITAWIAFATNDGLVTEDYYRKGLAAHQTVARSERAAALGLQASIVLTEASMQVRLAARDDAFQAPPELRVTLSHPTRAGMDAELLLTRDGDGYVGRSRLPVAGHWLILIEDAGRQWRLLGNAMLPASGAILIGGGSKPLPEAAS